MKNLFAFRSAQTLLLGLSLLAFAVSCSDDAADSASLDITAGTLTARPGAANTPVTDANKMQAGAAVQGAAFAAAGQALAQGFTKALPGSPEMPLQANTSGKIDKTINGTRSGNMSIKGSYTVSNTGGMTMDLACVFNDYSNDGSLFIAGSMNYDLKTTVSGNTSSIDYKIKGAIRFNGTYEGQMTFDYTYVGSGTNYTLTMTGTFTSNGQTVSYSYKFPQ